ncbi:hypothetical protein [Aureimonas sp. AU12]|uniref:hypothetical protein n=1 Tax=Aureimonas sp. AU12 TaxID=1638161 RepID=UPI0007058F0E|nr:hypothetical protein [Aureimonas sp. AU12]BAT29760.1 excinuclease ABC C subunit domain protein [Aureimonas sp. AU12]
MFKVYRIRHLNHEGAELKSYVGLTARTLARRKDAHINEASRAKRSIHSLSLGAAIRAEIRSANNPHEHFQIELLEEYGTVHAMLEGEGRWIEELGTMAPNGYNLMPGGCSAGGPSNSKPMRLLVDNVLVEFPSIKAAAQVRARELEKDLDRFVGMVFMRIQNGWTHAEALEFESHEDGRGTELSRKARADGENVATVRSRAHRERIKTTAVAIPRGFNLPAPDGSGRKVPIKEFAEMSGVSQSTVMHRLHQIVGSIDAMASADTIDHLIRKQDRVKPIVVRLPDGTLVEGSRNHLAKEFSEGAYASYRTIHNLGYQALRTRLRKSGDRASNDEHLCALGVTAPKSDVPRLIVAEPVHRRKLKAGEYLLTADDGRQLRFVKQMDFVRECVKALEQLGRMPQQTETRRLRDKSLQSRITWMMGRHSPTEIARHLGVLECLFDDVSFEVANSTE